MSILEKFFDRIHDNPALLVRNMGAGSLRVWMVILLAERPVTREKIERTLNLKPGNEKVGRTLRQLEDDGVIRQTQEGWIRVRNINL